MNLKDIEALPALSLRQPWAWLVVRPDLSDPVERKIKCKDVENRVWNRSFRGRFLIHASKGMKEEEFESAMHFTTERAHTDTPERSALMFGGIVGVATITGVYRPADKPRSRWHIQDQYGYILEDIEPLPFVPCKGMLGFFKPDL